MELTEQEKKIIVDILQQVSLPIKDAPIVLEIIKKLQLPPAKTENEAIG